jgi:hypothetical protein
MAGPRTAPQLSSLFLTLSLSPPWYALLQEHLQERMIRAVASLGEAEVRDIQATEGKIEVCCEFCNEKYSFSEDEVLAYRR